MPVHALLLLALATPAQAGGVAPPPTPGFQLAAPAVVLTGTQPTVAARGVPANALTGLLGSPSVTGAPFCPGPLHGCSDLVGSGAVLGAERADAQGRVTFTLPVLPAFLAGRTVSLQAARPTATGPTLSTVRTMRVLDPQGDEDGDGLTNDEELSLYGTDPLLADTDGGGASDGVEVFQGTNPFDGSDDITVQEPDMAVGWMHTCRLFRDGTVLCDGDDTFGQSTPPVDGVFSDLATGRRETCGIDLLGGVTCWGEHGTYAAPVSGAVSLAHSETMACSVDTVGAVTCWTGATVVPTPLDTETAFRVLGYPGDVCAQRTDLTWACAQTDLTGTVLDVPLYDLEVDDDETCGVTPTNALVCLPGGLGLANAPEAALPYVDIEISQELPLMCGVHPDGTSTCWFLGFLPFFPDPTVIPDGLAAFDLGGVHGCGILDPTSDVVCWGPDFAGGADVPRPEAFAAVSGGLADCALRVDGSADCFARAGFDTGEPDPADRFADVSVGYGSSCGVRLDGTLACWGVDLVGAPTTTPPTGSTWVDVAVGAGGACALDATHHLTCWGGLLPVDPFPGATFQTVAPAGPGVCALDALGAVSCVHVDLTTFAVSTVVDPGPVAQIAGTALGTSFLACLRTPTGSIRCLGASTWTSPPGEVYTHAATGLWQDGAAVSVVACGLRADGSVRCDDLSGGTAWTSPPGMAWRDVSAGLAVCGITLDDDLECVDGGMRLLFPSAPSTMRYVHRTGATP
ncbi:MAG: hypothetical protein H6733_04565 [Alphaproteobacteria bacterium]|nr:hypothetical protein [Alphaproteobacteria bacterium]